MCIKCKKERFVGKDMLRLIERGEYEGKCLSCSSKGNKYRLLGKDYDTKKYYNTPIYKSWYNMKTRCTNKNTPNYTLYGERGIKICAKWMTFAGFLEDMGNSYKKGLTIERIDNHKGYSKSNCKWATRKEQALNTRNVERAARYSFNGVTLTVREWAEKINIKRTTLDMRLRKYKWPLEKALNY